MDLDGFRSQSNLIDQMLEYGTHDDLPDRDQSVLNHFFFKDFLPLPDQYNLQVGIEKNWDIYGIFADNNYLPTNLIGNLQRIKETMGPDTMKLLKSMREKFDQKNNGGIIHYISPDKPWSSGYITRYRTLWRQYYRLQWSKISENNNLPKGEVPQNVPLFCSILFSYPVFLDKIVQQLGKLELNLASPLASIPEMFFVQASANFHYYPNTLNYYMKQFTENCQAYLVLDPAQDENIIQRLTDRNCPIFTFECVADPKLIQTYPNYHVFPDNQVDNFMDEIKKVINQTKEIPLDGTN